MVRVRVRWPRFSAAARGPAAGAEAPRRRRWLRWLLAGGGVLAVAAALTGLILGYFLQLDLPDVQALEDYDPPQMTRVLAQNGVEIETYAEERRILIEFAGIPPQFLQALLAIEDTQFERHAGIDLKGTLRAVWRNVTTLSAAEGGSTITQQLARNLFLTPRKTLRRKVQEAILALDIERQYSKEEILRFYCNQIYMGHGRYGLEAASRFYYDRPARALTLSQAATLAGLIQRPETFSPLRNPERSRERRDVVLRRMVEVGYLTEEQAEAARQEAPQLNPRSGHAALAPYFAEEVRRWLQQRHGTTNLYREGLEVRTTLDPRLQALANAAIDHGLRELDRRQGWRGPRGRVPSGADPSSWRPPDWEHAPEVGAVREGVVVGLDPGRARVRVDRYEGVLGAEEVAWTERKDPARLLRVGDRVDVRLVELNADGRARLTLEQEPKVEAALVALDPATGAVRALVGGFAYERSEFDRATQARRQTGSAFKPFVYATALAHGSTLADSLVDAPTVFLDPRLPEPYQPENFGRKYYGRVTLRTALEHSTNAATVRLLERVGARAVIDTARRLGVTSALEPYPSLALGAFEISLIELTAAYGAFANGGVLVEPHLVEQVLDPDGSVVERVDPRVSEAVSPQIAFLMNRALAGVVTDGTGRAAAALDLPLAGKTGTTDDYADAWFVGYSPRLVVGVWVGFDERKSLGSRETGAHAALPIWLEFMEGARAEAGQDDFVAPAGVTLTSIDRNTGLKADAAASCDPVLTEVFLEGTEPTTYCTAAQHLRLTLPVPLQEYDLDGQGALLLPFADLDPLRQLLPTLVLDERSQTLSVAGTSGPVTLPYVLLVTAGAGEPAAHVWTAGKDETLVRGIPMRRE